MSSFAEDLAEARKASGMTQEELGNVIHVARNTISSWEHGRREPDLAIIRQLGQVLHYDFFHDKNMLQHETEENWTDDTVPAEKDLPSASSEEAPDETVPPEEDLPSPPADTPMEETADPAENTRMSKKKSRLLWYVCAAAMLLGAALFVFLMPRERPEAVIDVHPLESPAYMMQNTDIFEGDGYGWEYYFAAIHESDVSFKPELVVVNYCVGARIDSKLQVPYEEIRPWMDDDLLKKGDSPLHLLFGTNHTWCDHADFILRGTDVNGHRLEFRSTLELSQERK